MALASASKELESISALFEGTDPEDIEKQVISKLSKPPVDNDFNNLKNSQIQAILGAVCKSLGFDYPGVSFSIYKGAENYVFQPPSIFSNGKEPVIKWGEEQYSLSGDFPDNGDISDTRMKFKFKGDIKGTFEVVVSLDWDGEKDREDKVEQAEACETWEELLPLLKKRLGVKKQKDIFESGTKQLELIESELKQKEDNSYWFCEVKDDSGEHFAFFAPESFNLKVVKGKPKFFKVNKDKEQITFEGEIIPASNFVKMKDLEVGEEYKVINLRVDTTGYGGLILQIEKVGYVNGNTQFDRWWSKAVKGVELEDITPDNPLILTVRSRKELSNGNTKNQLRLRMGDAEKENDLLSSLVGGNIGNTDEPSESTVDTDTKEEKLEDDSASSTSDDDEFDIDL